MGDALVSVVIPTYNRESMLTGALKSVVNQTYRKIEAIIVDDGSTDGTENTVRSFSDPRIKYVRQGNQGVAAARNKGIKLSKGKYISFLDSDDIYERSCIEMKVAVAENDGKIILVGGGCSYFGSDYESRLPGNLPRSSIEYEDLCLFTAYPGGTSNIFARTDAVIRSGGFDERLTASEDRDLLIRLSRLGKIVSVNDFTVKIRIHHEARPNRSRAKIAQNREMVSNKIPERLLRQRSKAWNAMVLGIKSWQGGNKSKAFFYWSVSFAKYPFPIHSELLRFRVILRDYLFRRK